MADPFMQQAIELALQNVRAGEGGPFSALVVRGDTVIAEGSNRVTTSYDPTAHAEIIAIRKACDELGVYHLDGCDLYTTCEPCPMCMGAIYWAHLDRVFYASTREDAAAAGFDDAYIYEELRKPPRARSMPMIQSMRDEGYQVFEAWMESDTKVPY
ncbi:MAG: tRNA-specific adenosine deaminase [Bacteroidetes bacterium]|jgi:tRNA(Arg) A34 adenosine deaminase TadA|nr:tRNA-specific adenosine deaminase [Bacteroidota bacterium]